MSGKAPDLAAQSATLRPAWRFVMSIATDFEHGLLYRDDFFKVQKEVHTPVKNRKEVKAGGIPVFGEPRTVYFADDRPRFVFSTEDALVGWIQRQRARAQRKRAQRKERTRKP